MKAGNISWAEGLLMLGIILNVLCEFTLFHDNLQSRYSYYN